MILQITIFRAVVGCVGGGVGEIATEIAINNSLDFSFNMLLQLINHPHAFAFSVETGWTTVLFDSHSIAYLLRWIASDRASAVD